MINLKYLFCISLLAAMISLTACSNEDTIGNDCPYASFTMSASQIPAEEEVLFASTTTGGSGVYSLKWDFGDGASATEAETSHSYAEKGIYKVTLNVADANGRTTEYSKVITVLKKVVQLGSVELLWASSTSTNQFRGTSVSMSPDQTRIYATSEDHTLHCYDAADGSEIWALNLRDEKYGTGTSGNTLCTPAVDTDGTIFIGTGTTSGKLFAVNPDGSVKWCAYNDPATGFWNNGKPAAVYIGITTPLIHGNYVYVGNRGSAGTCVAFDKNTGLRANFVTRPGSPTSGPAGGFQTDIVLNKDGMLYLYCNTYGIGAIPLSAFSYDNSAAFMAWQSVERDHTRCAGASAIDSEGNLIAMTQENAMNHIVCLATDGSVKWKTPITEAGLSDQGGISIAADGTIYAALKATGDFPGGIVALNADGSRKWLYGIPENVSSAPAIDSSGNIVFATELGNLYVISADGQQTLASVDLASTLSASGKAYASDWVPTKAKVWSSPLISTDGVIVMGLTNTNDMAASRVIALRAGGVDGLATGGWPMRGHDARHTCTAR